MRRFGAPALLLLFFLAACVAPQPKPLEPVAFDALPGWSMDDPAAALPALRRSCPKMPEAWRPACQAIPDDPAGARAYFEAEFQPWRVTAPGFVTGYYEPELNGSTARSPRYQVPLHRLPGDLVQVDLGEFRETLRGERIAGRVENGRLKPYFARADIARGALDGRDLELLWVDDPVDAFFLEIQGSGRVRLEDGRLLRVGFAGQNGQRYVAIGRALLDDGEIAAADVSMQSIRAWLAAYPEKARGLLDRNPSYVFFRLLEGDGPIGAQDVALTPGRSLAVDRTQVTLGTPVFLDLDHPDSPGGILRRLVIAQDTGGAIRGAGRGDLFLGPGHEAGEIAGRMKARGTLYLLLPRGVAPTS
ncbi:MAG: murein transglycosylase [Alphaproteobacteria bacterium]|nr:murein transglycosylase [Alphaproteobacteria bacterium]